MNEGLSANTSAILLLTAPLLTGRGQSAGEVLSATEYGKLALRLKEVGGEPGELLTPSGARLRDACQPLIERSRLDRLLGRGFALSQAIERWQTRSIWVVSRADAAYPARFKSRLRENSPPVLYGCGEASILSSGGLAVVGSRNADDVLIEYARDVGRMAASARQTIVSGGARGIDHAAMLGALDNGGRVAAVLADGLESAAMRRENRSPLLEKRLVLVSPYDPSAGFNVGNAMQRNKLIYALADAALVVTADLNKGGTWEGAIEQLQKLQIVPVYVRTSGAQSGALTELRKRGALPWPDPGAADLEAVLSAQPRKPAAVGSQPDLFAASGATGLERASRGNPLRPDATTVREQVIAVPTTTDFAEDMLQAVRQLVLRIINGPTDAAEIARALGVTQPQARKWLTQLVDAGVLKKGGRPARYSKAP
jgi:predicted Rossmann fold nucleotide-binding protein DprA/Smf involved in DNA uptake